MYTLHAVLNCLEKIALIRDIYIYMLLNVRVYCQNIRQKLIMGRKNELAVSLSHMNEGQLFFKNIN